MWTKFVADSHPRFEGFCLFLSGYSSFAPSTKTSILKFQFNPETMEVHVKTTLWNSAEIPIYNSLYLFTIINILL